MSPYKHCSRDLGSLASDMLPVGQGGSSGSPGFTHYAVLPPEQGNTFLQTLPPPLLLLLLLGPFPGSLLGG